ncbi:MAG: hypothetical protein C0423_03250 [Methylibium sp.]|nr:hypothetical protein [Methylibium sp.]
MALLEDLTAFFNPDEFGTRALLDWVEVVGIFNNKPSQAFDLMSTSMPTFTLPTARCADVRVGSELQVGATIAAYPMSGGGVLSAAAGQSTRYRVCAPPEPSGTGLTTLRLELLP